jgi:hypothetical protein
MLRLGRLAAVTFAALALSACATMNVSSHVERGTDFTQFRTWDWGPADELPTGDPRLDNNAFFQDHMLGAVEKQMAAKGYVRSTLAGSPDLLVHYHANISQRFDVNGVDRQRGYCNDNCEPQVYEYQEGTLVLDVVNARTNKLVWRGWAQDSLDGVIDNQDRLDKEVDRAVTNLFKLFPRTL